MKATWGLAQTTLIEVFRTPSARPAEQSEVALIGVDDGW